MSKNKKDVIGGGDFVPPEAVNAKDIRDLVKNPFDLPLLSEFLNGSDVKDSLLLDYSIDSSAFGDFAVLEFHAAGKFRCNSQAVVDQVKALLASGDGSAVPVNVHVAKKTNKNGQIYFSLLG